MVGFAPGWGTTVRVVTDTVVPGDGLITRVTAFGGVVTVRVCVGDVVVVVDE